MSGGFFLFNKAIVFCFNQILYTGRLVLEENLIAGHRPCHTRFIQSRHVKKRKFNLAAPGLGGGRYPLTELECLQVNPVLTRKCVNWLGNLALGGPLPPHRPGLIWPLLAFQGKSRPSHKGLCLCRRNFPRDRRLIVLPKRSLPS